MFEKYGEVDNIVCKRNRNSEYCFAFAEFKDHNAAKECVKQYQNRYAAMIKATLAGNRSKSSFRTTTREGRTASMIYEIQQRVLQLRKDGPLRQRVPRQQGQ
jgi:hypothetical protein